MKEKITDNRYELIGRYVKDKKVLDIGCVDNDWTDNIGKLHILIKKKARYVLGIDYNKKGIARLKKKGIKNIMYGNAETFISNEKFDVVIAGELIEHVSNQGLMIETAKRNLKDKGLLIITTPNVFTIGVLIKALLGLKVYRNPEHVIWHDMISLEAILKRHGFKIKERYYFFPKKNILDYFIQRFFCFFNKKLAPRLMIVCQK